MSNVIHELEVLALETFPILQLKVSAPAGLGRVLRVQGQVLVESFHVTLARPDKNGHTMAVGIAELPAPPKKLRLCQDIRFVRTAEKQSCFVELDATSQEELRAYVRRCEAISGLALYEAERVFHVTLSNAGGGLVQASVGAVWLHQSDVLSP